MEEEKKAKAGFRDSKVYCVVVLASAEAQANCGYFGWKKLPLGGIN